MHAGSKERAKERPKERRFRLSALTEQGSFLTTAQAEAWLMSTAGKAHLSVRQVPFSELGEWSFDPATGDLGHHSGKFFQVHGLRVHVETDSVVEWEQPILNQPEIGILGIIAKEFDGHLHFLMQAKMEPGNPLGVQMVPTVQATKSNYTQVHQGARPLYVDHMLDRSLSRVLVDQLQYEQGSAFFRKRNRNIVVEVTDDLPVEDGYQWLTLGQVKALLRCSNLVSMDTRTVISCLSLVERGHHPFDADGLCPPDTFGAALLTSAAQREQGASSTDELLYWLTDLKCRWRLSAERIGLDAVTGWSRTPLEIAHDGGRFFRVVAVQVESDSREVSRWSQPLLAPSAKGLVGFLVKSFGGLLHFLVQARVEPGNVEAVALAPTVQCGLGFERADDRSSAPIFADLLANAPEKWIRYAATQSEEGGRFFGLESDYRIVELPGDINPSLPENFRWMTLGQLNEMLRFGLVNIEARNVLSCLSFTPQPE